MDRRARGSTMLGMVPSEDAMLTHLRRGALEYCVLAMLETGELYGLERLDYATWNVLIGGLGNVPEDVGIKVRKFTENLTGALAEDVRQDVQASAMSHADHNLCNALAAGQLDGQAE